MLLYGSLTERGYVRKHERQSFIGQSSRLKPLTETQVTWTLSDQFSQYFRLLTAEAPVIRINIRRKKGYIYSYHIYTIVFDCFSCEHIEKTPEVRIFQPVFNINLLVSRYLEYI